MKGMAAAFGSRRRYEGAQRLARLGRGPLANAAAPGWTAMRDLPEPPKETFRDWWRHREPRPAPPREPAVGGDVTRGTARPAPAPPAPGERTAPGEAAAPAPGERTAPGEAAAPAPGERPAPAAQPDDAPEASL